MEPRAGYEEKRCRKVAAVRPRRGSLVQEGASIFGSLSRQRDAQRLGLCRDWINRSAFIKIITGMSWVEDWNECRLWSATNGEEDKVFAVQ